ncbi:hypothetical protein DPMN_102941 [Dreissena polymorpha]|uniref:Uncharacterized protein n=1 Tax=Dreissena polymorpha TaxID=45954 RepID=A0A9D4K2G9_DREPO|nr:hypothetical protein DPMN_102941 [Dreissena polymorpha]
MHPEHSQSNSVSLRSDSDPNLSMTPVKQSDSSQFPDENADDRRVSSGVGTTSENGSLSEFDSTAYTPEEEFLENEMPSGFRRADQSQMRHADMTLKSSHAQATSNAHQFHLELNEHFNFDQQVRLQTYCNSFMICNCSKLDDNIMPFKPFFRFHWRCLSIFPSPAMSVRPSVRLSICPYVYTNLIPRIL